VYNRLAATQIAAEKPGEQKYKDRRLISMYFDLTNMPPGDKLRALESAQKFIRTQMTSADLVSLMRYQGTSSMCCRISPPIMTVCSALLRR